MKIPVTRGFDALDLLGELTLRDDVEIPPDSVFSLTYRVLERSSAGTPTKIQLLAVSLISDESYLQSLQAERAKHLTNG